jgi:prolyl-tRNA editing enzyme YbaK/EbsC (Cys-tRNA(Pro) deacylase)
MPVYVDPEVMAHDEVVFAGGTQTESVKMRTEDVFRDGTATIVPLTRHPEEEEKDPLG